MSEAVHLCLSDLLDQDLTSQEYFNTLPDEIRQKLLQTDEVRTFVELQETAARLIRLQGEARA